MYFSGDAPSIDKQHWGPTEIHVYYLPGTKGWGKEFGGRPTAMWMGRRRRQGLHRQSEGKP